MSFVFREHLKDGRDTTSLYVERVKGSEESCILDLLTPPQVRVLYSSHQPNGVIARELAIGESTVRTHFHHILKKFGLSRQSYGDALTLGIAIHEGFVPLEITTNKELDSSLSLVEERILRLHCQGFTYKEIGSVVYPPITDSTVRVHLNNIRGKLACKGLSKRQFVYKVAQLGLIDSNFIGGRGKKVSDIVAEVKEKL